MLNTIEPGLELPRLKPVLCATDPNTDIGTIAEEKLLWLLVREQLVGGTFYIPGLGVENHRFMTPFRGNGTLCQLERRLQAMIAEDAGDDRFEGGVAVSASGYGVGLFPD